MTPPTPPDPDRLPPAFAAALEAHSAREQHRRITPPDGFAVRVAAGALARYRWERWVKWATGATVVLLAIGGGYFAFRPSAKFTPQQILNTPEPAVEPRTPTLSDSLSEAGEALASLSRNAADRAVGPTRSLYAGVESLRLPAPKVATPTVEPATQSLAAVPAAAKSSLEPLAANTRRALHVFLRDTGLQTSN